MIPRKIRKKLILIYSNYLDFSELNMVLNALDSVKDKESDEIFYYNAVDHYILLTKGIEVSRYHYPDSDTSIEV